MKEVLFISYYFPPIGGAGVQRSAKFAKYLPQFGWKPIVLSTTADDYQIHREFQLDDSVGAGLDETQYEVHCLRDPEPRRTRRLLEKLRIFPLFWFFLYPFFWEPQVFWALAAVAKGARLIRKKKISVIYTTSGPYSSILTGLLLKWLTRKPWVVDLRDPWTMNFIGMWPSVIHQKLERWFARFALRRADHVIVNTPVSKRLFEELLGARAKGTVSYVTNGYDEEDFSDSKSMQDSRVFRIAHVGSFGTGVAPAPKRGLKRLLDAVKRRPKGYDTTTYSARYFLEALQILAKENQVAPEGFQASLVGFVPDECKRTIEKHGLEDLVDVRGYLPHSQAIAQLENASALWLSLPMTNDGRPLPLVPGKLYEYMRAGKPVLALIPPGDAHDFLKEAGLGFFADPRDPKDIARVLLQMYECHRNGNTELAPNWKFIRQFERRELTKKLAGVLEAVDSAVQGGNST
jgi:glycosyltransferase involved in cell wall biosynthesis